jgi:Ca2+-transporting ATPase
MAITLIHQSKLDPESSPRWWALTADKVLQDLAANAAIGLTDSEARKRRNQYGPNELTEEPPVPLWKKIIGHINDLFIWILVVAAGISAIIGDLIDMSAILAIVVLNVAIEVFQEERASRALAALRKLSAPTAKVIRDSSLQSIDARDIVPGDILEMEAGDNVPACAS